MDSHLLINKIYNIFHLVTFSAKCYFFKIPGQRALGLHLLSTVLDKALCYICKDRTGNMTKKGNKVDKSVDWEAVWTYALGPQPELALSLR